jgi:protein SCO1/2
MPSMRSDLLALVLATLAGLAAPACAQTAGRGDAAPTAAPEPAEPVRATPRYLLQGSHGRAVTSEDFRGRFQLIAFGFTSCPDVCPTTLLEMQQVLAALGARARHLQPIFITVDPQRDSRVVLDAYTRAFDARILGLTGSIELVRRAADNFKVSFEKVQEPGAAANVYTMDHSTGMFLLGPDGQLLGKFGYSTPVRDIVARIERWMAVDGK